MKKSILNERIVNKVVDNTIKRILEGFQRKANYFEVKGMLPHPVDFSNANKTDHWSKDRSNRSNVYNLTSKGDGVYSFIVDTNHPNGYEIHTITEKAFIVIQNEETENLVTVLAARPGQIKRYWTKRGKELPKDRKFNYILNCAYKNVENGLNNINEMKYKK